MTDQAYNQTTDFDGLLRRVITEAQTEWDMQAAITDEEEARLIEEKFNGSEDGYDAYMRERLHAKFSNILIAASRAPFMKDQP